MEENNKGLFSSVLTTPVRRWVASILIGAVVIPLMVGMMSLLVTLVGKIPSAIFLTLFALWLACISNAPVSIVRNIAAPGNQTAVAVARMAVCAVIVVFWYVSLSRVYFDWGLFLLIVLAVVVGAFMTYSRLMYIITTFIKPAWRYIMRVFKA